MAVEPRPASRATVVVAGQRYELVPTAKLTFPETREAKRVSGMALVDMEAGLGKADPDAWLAWLYVSMKRTLPGLTSDELERLLGDTPIVAIIESVEEETPEVASPDPPAHPSQNGDGDETNDDGSGETTLLLSTPATSGSPTWQTPT